MNSPSENPYRLIWFGWWVTLVTVSDLYLVPPLLPNLIDKFAIDVSLAGWIAGTYQIGAALIVLPAGLWADKLGCRWVLIVSMSAFALGELVSAVAPSYALFLFGRFFVGAGSAGASLGLLSYVGLHIPYNLRGKVMGFIGTGYFLAVSFGPLVVTQVADRTSFQVLFLMYTLLAAVGVGHAAFSLGPDPKHDRIAGSWSDFLEVAKNRAFWGIVIVQSLFTLGVVPMIQYFGDWLESVHNMDTQARGFVFAIGGIPILAGSPVGGWISDRIGNKPFFLLVTGALAFLVCVMPYMDDSRTGVLLAFSAVGFAAAARYSSYHALATRLIGEELLGHLLAFRNFLNYLVTGAGVVVMGYVYESGDGAGYVYLGWIASFMLFLSIPFLVTMIPREPQRSS